MPDPIDTTEAARQLGVSRPRVIQLIAAGQLKAAKLGRDWMIKPSDIAKLAAKERKPGRPPTRRP